MNILVAPDSFRGDRSVLQEVMEEERPKFYIKNI